MGNQLSRRDWLYLAGLAAARPVVSLASTVPTAPVSIAKCASYGAELGPAMEGMFDRLGGLGQLVKGKTVAIKLNLTGNGTDRLGHLPAGAAHWVHPRVVGTTVHLLAKAGARRIRLLESPWTTVDPLEEFVLRAGWEPFDFTGAAARVEWENTNFLGRGKRYTRFPVPHGGLLYPAYDLNHSYEDCDVFVSLAKLKEHATTGVTLTLKNCFGITPCTIYGTGCGVDEPSLEPRGGRGPFHAGDRQPSKSAPPEKDPTTPRQGGYRVPRVVADLAAARPIHLGILDGIDTMAGGEGPWIPGVSPVRPGVLIAGTNAVTTDAVATAVMGFDPAADRGTPPFETCDNTMRLAERLGVGTCDLSRIEVRGATVREARFDFAALRAKRRPTT